VQFDDDHVIAERHLPDEAIVDELVGQAPAELVDRVHHLVRAHQHENPRLQRLVRPRNHPARPELPEERRTQNRGVARLVADGAHADIPVGRRGARERFLVRRVEAQRPGEERRRRLHPILVHVDAKNVHAAIGERPAQRHAEPTQADDQYLLRHTPLQLIRRPPALPGR